MTLVRQTFDNGFQDDVITAANSATSGDALSQIIQNLNGTGLYETGAAIRGAKGAHVTGALNDTFSMSIDNTSAASGSAQVYFRINSYPTAGGAFFRMRSTSGNVCLIYLNPSGVLSLQNSAGTGLKNFMNNQPLNLNTAYCIQIQGTPNASTTAGFIAAQLYDSTSILIDTYSSSAVNAGTVLNVVTAQVGKLVTSSDSFDMCFDELAFDTGTTTPLPLKPYVFTNTAEGGFDGVDATVANTGGGSGDAFTTVTPGTGTVRFSNITDHSGGLSYAITPGTGSAAFIGYTWPATFDTMSLAIRTYIYLTAYPTVATQMIFVGNAGSVMSLAVNATGTPIAQDNTGTVNTGATALPLNTWLRCETSVEVGTSTSNGTIIINIFNGDSTTSPLYSYASNNRNTTINSITGMRIGKSSNTGNWSTLYIDDIAVSDSGLIIEPANTATFSWLLGATGYSGKRNSFMGLAAGTAMTTLNSGGASGNSFNSTAGSVTVQTSADLTAAYDRGIVASLSANDESSVSWSHYDYSSGSYVRCYVRRSATPGVSQRVARGYSGSTMLWEIRWQADGQMVLANYSTGTWMSSVAGATALNTVYRVEAYMTSTSGELRVYAGESTTAMTTTPQPGVPDSGAWDSTRFGLMTTSVQTMSIDVAAVAIDPSGWIGPAQ